MSKLEELKILYHAIGKEIEKLEQINGSKKDEMKVIAKGRGNGKTAELINMSHETKCYISVQTPNQAKEIFARAKSQGFNIPYPILYSDLIGGKLRSTSVAYRGVLIDEAQILLKTLIDVPITAMTITIEED